MVQLRVNWKMGLSNCDLTEVFNTKLNVLPLFHWQHSFYLVRHPSLIQGHSKHRLPYERNFPDRYHSILLSLLA